MIIKLESKKRPIIKVNINGVKHCALIDTGASVSIVSNEIEQSNREYQSNVIGAGGERLKLYYPRKTVIDIEGIRLTNFLLGNISSVTGSIKKQTGIKISMIIGTPDIRCTEMKIDLWNNIVNLGE